MVPVSLTDSIIKRKGPKEARHSRKWLASFSEPPGFDGDLAAGYHFTFYAARYCQEAIIGAELRFNSHLLANQLQR